MTSVNQRKLITKEMVTEGDSGGGNNDEIGGIGSGGGGRMDDTMNILDEEINQLVQSEIEI